MTVAVAAAVTLAPSILSYWVKAHKAGKLGDIGKMQKPLTEIEMELAKVKRENAQLRMERDILKKAAAYFARESLPGELRRDQLPTIPYTASN